MEYNCKQPTLNVSKELSTDQTNIWDFQGLRSAWRPTNAVNVKPRNKSPGLLSCMLTSLSISPLCKEKKKKAGKINFKLAPPQDTQLPPWAVNAFVQSPPLTPSVWAGSVICFFLTEYGKGVCHSCQSHFIKLHLASRSALESLLADLIKYKVMWGKPTWQGTVGGL